MQVLDNQFLRGMEQIFDPVPVPMILVDKAGIVIMINDSFASYLEHTKEEIIGHPVQKIDKNTRFPYVLQKKVADIAQPHLFENGHTAIVHRIPVMDDHGEVLYGFGMVLFQDIDGIKEIIKRNKQLDLELFHVRSELKRIIGAKYSWDTIIGESDPMMVAKHMGMKAALTTSNVLLLGESGTGKELFAHAIHNDSGRSFGPFIKLNCAAIPRELLEAELFGYEEGAFTGAKKGGNIGKFELANKGTIFLDEIGDMPMEMQVKLLRVLQEREFERIGGHETIKVDVRVIAATNKDLPKLIQDKLFREDLYYRLNVMTLLIPPLRDRGEDLPLLVDTLVAKLSDAMGRMVIGVTPAFLERLKSQRWPGNVRELENVIERAINMCDTQVLEVQHLPARFEKTQMPVTGGIRPLSELYEEVERQAITNALVQLDGNKLHVAKALGLARSTLYEKMAKYGL
jgi:PAS domain S-box-containing protein